MRRFIPLIAVLIAISAFAAPETWTGICTNVHDGDTITVTHGADTRRVRLCGIDAPELTQPFGREAEAALHALVFNRPVTVYSTGTDKYGRFIGWVFSGSERVNLDMVTDGYAWWYREYEPNNVAIKSAEATARANRAGLWFAPGIPISPWDFRHLASEAKAASERAVSSSSSVPDFAPTETPVPPGLTSEYDPGKTQWVRPYRKKDGTAVPGYWRHASGTAPRPRR